MTTKKMSVVEFGKIGNNVSARIEGTKLILEMDMISDLGISGSGKSHLVASTRGNVSVLFDNTTYKLGINLYKPVNQ